MDINRIIIYIMVFFVLVGAADRILGSRYGLGEKFEAGIMAMGTLTISTAGILILAPILGDLFRPVIVPFFEGIGSDPAMFAGMLIDVDIGGAPLARQLASSQDGYALGLITASMLGATITFNIPVGMSIVKKEYQKDVAKGMLIGIITIPVGIIVGGLVAGISVGTILINMVPVAALSLIIVICLWKWERQIVALFIVLGKIILGVSIFGIGIGVIAEFTTYTPIDNALPLEEAIMIIGNVAVILAGAFVLVELITRALRKPMQRAGERIGINETTISGLLITLANDIPVFSMLPDMDERGRIIAVAFSASGAFVFGDHLGFIAGYAPEMVAAIVAAKLSAAITAAVLAMAVVRAEQQRPGKHNYARKQEGET